MPMRQPILHMKHRNHAVIRGLFLGNKAGRLRINQPRPHFDRGQSNLLPNDFSEYPASECTPISTSVSPSTLARFFGPQQVPLPIALR